MEKDRGEFKSALLLCVAACREQVPSQAGERVGDDVLMEVSWSQSIDEAGFCPTWTASREFHNKLAA